MLIYLCLQMVVDYTWPEVIRNYTKQNTHRSRFMSSMDDIKPPVRKYFKNKTLIFRNRHKISKINNPGPLTVKGKPLSFVEKYTYLGIVLDSEMSLQPFLK